MKLDEKKRMEAQIEGEELEKLSIQFIKEKQRMVRLFEFSPRSRDTSHLLGECR